MHTIRELVYLIKDKLKFNSDDSTFNENHIAFLLTKYRPVILLKAYKKSTDVMHPENLQTLTVPLSRSTQALDFTKTPVLTSERLPYILDMSAVTLSPISNELSRFDKIDPEVMPYHIISKYLRNHVFYSISNAQHLVLKSERPEFLQVTSVELTAPFSDCLEVYQRNSGDTTGQDYFDSVFPMESKLLPELVTLVMKDLYDVRFSPQDAINNATDDTSDLASYIQRNVKSELAKQVFNA